MDLKSYLIEKRKLVDDALSRYLPPENLWPISLHQAMRYSVMAGGKRLRPILTLAGCQAVEGDLSLALPTACSLELIHTYSLIHDDLPAMDNDDLRRGKPTNHKVFGEAIAILAGDSLLTEAFQLIIQTPIQNGNTHKLLEVISKIAEAAGSKGMAGGQVLDLESEGKKITYEELQRIHNHKTGKLIQASVYAGGLLGNASPSQIESLNLYGEKIGLAFQITDDILDIEGGEEIGKDIGSDVANEKSTYPSLLGIDRSKKLASELVTEAIHALEGFSGNADPLRAIADYIIHRKS